MARTGVSVQKAAHGLKSRFFQTIPLAIIMLSREKQDFISNPLLMMVIAWSFIFITGSRLPYIYTEFSFQIRAYVIFPLLFFGMGYFGMLHKFKGKRAKYNYSNLTNAFQSRRRRVLFNVNALLGLLFMTAGFSWTLSSFTAWATRLVATSPYIYESKIVDIQERSGPKWSTLFDLTLTNFGSEKVDLRLNRRTYEKDKWKVGDTICVRGKQSIFGAIAERVSKGDCFSSRDHSVMQKPFSILNESRY